ncbi:MAG: M1 family metallopeptidase [Schleiferiaceae bacterium]|nr:M1 family metallopeptidase [Schleiferiaceae bacterium]
MSRLPNFFLLFVTFMFTGVLVAQEGSFEFPELQISTDSIRKQPRYNAAAPKHFIVHHTQLNVSFNWERRELDGEATLFLSPYFYDQDTLELDAKHMLLHEIKDAKTQRPLSFAYDKSLLRIALQKTVTKNDTLAIAIKYTAQPDSLPKGTGQAITSDKGLFFINADGKDADKPRQIWTQGEPESNSVWFPTIDKPNQRMTHEIAITVDTGMVTLSNGYLDFSVVHGDGLRTDFWVMDQPHAPYLTMMAVGDFTIINENNGRVPMDYYMEPSYANFARMIFGETPRMIDFFSDVLGVPYPWNKYSQVIVRDYVSGAMENTTAVIFGEFMNMDEYAFNDNPMQDIIAHELFHHWFGDLVTCKSWANLPLNESFATYGEILWREHRYGIDEADYGRYNDWLSYYRDYRFSGAKQLIRYDYEAPLFMFDGHSYAKGGRILHMLRNQLGDAAFFQGLKTYLEDNMYQDVEIHQLRLAFEKVTGLDLAPFFNQWFLAAGHPIVAVEYAWDDKANTLTVHMQQKQDIDRFPLFDLPIPVDIVVGKERIRKVLPLKNEKQQFTIPLKKEPSFVTLDPAYVLLAEWQETISEEWLWQRFQQEKRGITRMIAFDALLRKEGEKREDAVVAALKDEFWPIRNRGLNAIHLLSEKPKKKALDRVMELAEKDEKTTVRASAINKLTYEYHYKNEQLAKRALSAKSYAVMAQGLVALSQINEPEAREIALGYVQHKSPTLQYYAWKALAATGENEDYPLFKARLATINRFNRSNVIVDFGTYLSRATDSVQELGVDYLEQAALTSGDSITRYTAIQAMVRVYEKWEEDLQTKPMTGAERKALPGKIKALRSRVDALREEQ